VSNREARHSIARAAVEAPRSAAPRAAPGSGSDAVGKLIASWKLILGFCVGVAALGWGARQVVSSYASKQDVGATAAAVQALDKRVTVTESSVARMEKTLDRIDAQLFEIAKATGAKTVTQP
jgi:hypothetical protein